MTMTSLERVSMALSHREPDRVPVYPILSGVSRNLIGASYKDWAWVRKPASIISRGFTLKYTGKLLNKKFSLSLFIILILLFSS